MEGVFFLLEMFFLVLLAYQVYVGEKSPKKDSPLGVFSPSEIEQTVGNINKMKI